MKLFRTINGVNTEIPFEDTVVSRPVERDGAQVMEDIVYPIGTLQLMSDSQLAELGLAMDRTPPVPVQVTSAQGALALLDAGLYSQVEAAVAAGSPELKIWWSRANVWDRNSPVLNALAAQFGLSSAQVDDLFRLAATKG